MGRPKKYHTEEEARKAHNERRKARRAAARGGAKPKSWVKSLSKKLDQVLEPEAPKDETPPERSGEPFADLPPLDLPSTGATESTDAPSASAPESTSATDATPSTPSPSEGSEKSSSTEGTKKVFDTDQIQKMAYGLGKMYMIETGKYAAQRGYFAFGEEIAEIVGMACAVIVKKRAEEMQIDDEEGAAWCVGIFAGTNTVQAVRAYREEKDKRDREERAKANAQRSATEAVRHQNGVNASDVAAAKRAEQQHTQQATSRGPVI